MRTFLATALKYDGRSITLKVRVWEIQNDTLFPKELCDVSFKAVGSFFYNVARELDKKNIINSGLYEPDREVRSSYTQPTIGMEYQIHALHMKG